MKQTTTQTTKKKLVINKVTVSNFSASQSAKRDAQQYSQTTVNCTLYCGTVQTL